MITAIVAAHDEADRIADTVRALRGFADRVVVVDDGSTDATAATVRETGGEVVVSPRRRGKGQALEFALDSLGVPEGTIVFADADLGATAANLGALLECLETADLVIAVLPPQGGGFGTVKRFARWSIRRLGGLEVTEPLSGQRAVNAVHLGRLRPLAGGYGVETAMSIDAGRLGMRVREVPVELRHRATGRDLAGFAHRARQGLDIAVAVARRAGRRR